MRLVKISLLVILTVTVSGSSFAQEKLCVPSTALDVDKTTGKPINFARAMGAIQACVKEKPTPKVKSKADMALRDCQAFQTYEQMKVKKDTEETKWRGGCDASVVLLRDAIKESATTPAKAPAAPAAKNFFAGYEEKLAVAKGDKAIALRAQIMKLKDEYNKNCPISVAMTCKGTMLKLSPLMAQFNAAQNEQVNAAKKGPSTAAAGARVLSMPTKHR